jgi:hydrogenase maturation protein HypF
MQSRFQKVIQAGQIVLVKGVGGYQLMCDATDEQAVDRLRHIKRREHKPFALLLGSLQQASQWTELSAEAECELQATHRPIVVARRIARAEAPSGGLGSEIALARSVSNFECSLGVMLPNNPMQYLLTSSLESPLVLTSANDSAEPMLIDDSQALERFAGSVGGILSHNRTIVQSLEDPIAIDTPVGLIPVRLGRGNAPCRLEIASLASSPLLARPAIAMGADLKAAWAQSDSRGIRLMQHLGDASHPEVYARLERSVQGALVAQSSNASTASNASIARIATDRHPGYQTTQLGAKLSRGDTGDDPGGDPGGDCTAIQHHAAHLGALALDLRIPLEERFLGFVFDGTGYGGPAEIWGGELIAIEGHEMTRLGHLRPFRLPKGDVSARNPWRSALALLTDAGIGFDEVRASCDWAQRSPWALLSESQRSDYVRLATSQDHTVLSSSMGRWLDAIGSLLGLVHVNHYEGHAPMMLEDCATRYAIDMGLDRLRNLGRIEQDAEEYRFTIAPQGTLYQIDGRGILSRLLEDLRNGLGVGCIAYRVHGAIAQLLIDTLEHLDSPWAESRRVGLTGGVFQNRLLVELASDRLGRAGWQALFHRRIPPNDSGIAAGQLRLLRP